MNRFAIFAVIVLVTAATRFAPFLIFGENRKTPPVIAYLGQVLPYAVMAMLVVYCLKGISFSAPAHFVPELLCTALVVVLHVWKRNTLLSIAGGTVAYMVLVQAVF